MVKAIVGANWGDEGKGKITDMLAGDSDIVIRFQGGANAGHTIKNEFGKFSLHLLPSGVFHENVVNIIGNGVAFNIESFLSELGSLKEKGIKLPRIMISDRAQVLMPYHVLFDKYEEERLGSASFGSTKSGIAPFYSDKFAKIGVQVSELFDEEHLYKKLDGILEVKNIMLRTLYKKPEIDKDELFAKLIGWREEIKDFVADTHSFINKAVKEGKNILLEGQLGALRDTDHGIYPMVTSSSTLAGYGAVGAGIPPYEIKEIIATVKAYSSCVGAGVFVSEIFGEEANTLRENGADGGEYGATTGRPRRVGWFDAVATRYGVQCQGATQVALTILDALSYLEEIPVCVGYEIDGKIEKDFPVTCRAEKAKPVLKVMPGFKCDISGIREYDKLPKAARDYVEFIESEIGCPITMISNGPAREDIIYR